MPVAEASAASAAAKMAFTLSAEKSFEEEYADPRELEGTTAPSDDLDMIFIVINDKQRLDQPRAHKI